MQNPYFDHEYFWLQRRIQFLQKLDALSAIDAHYDEFETLALDFKQVEHPSDLVARLKDVYGPEFK